MFYVVSATGNFLAGFVPAGQAYVQVYEGTKTGDLVKINKKLDCVALSVDDAWDRLCEEIVKARADGYRLAPFDTSTIEAPHDVHQGEIPYELRGIYAHVSECTEEHFSAGVQRLEAVHEVLSQGGCNVVLKTTDRDVKLTLGRRTIQFGLAHMKMWDSMSTKAKELCEERGMFTGNFLLPSGEGLWRMQTCETELDLYVRAFMAGAMEAGAAISFSADHAWVFSPQRSFHAADVATLQWYQQSPRLLNLVHKLKPVAAPAVTDDASDLFLFL